MSDVVAGIGTLFKRWNGLSYEDIAEVVSIDNEKTRNMVDVTSLSSTEGYKESIGANRDAGTFQLTMNFTRDTYDLLNSDYENSSIKNYKIVVPDDAESCFTFTGFVSNLGLGIPTDDKISANVILNASGRCIISSGILSALFDDTFDETFN